MCVVLITLLIEVDCEHFYCDFEEFLELAAAFARRVSPGGGRKTPAGHFSTAGVRFSRLRCDWWRREQEMRSRWWSCVCRVRSLNSRLSPPWSQGSCDT